MDGCWLHPPDCQGVSLASVAAVDQGGVRQATHTCSAGCRHTGLKPTALATRHTPMSPQVADFGLAMPLSAGDSHATLLARGTPTHMSPELFTAGHISKASDVFAYGVLLFEIMTGQRAYAGVPIPLLPHEVAVQGLRPQWPPGMPPGCRDLRRLAESCWAHNPQDRCVGVAGGLVTRLLVRPERASGPCGMHLGRPSRLRTVQPMLLLPDPAPTSCRPGFAEVIARLEALQQQQGPAAPAPASARATAASSSQQPAIAEAAAAAAAGDSSSSSSPIVLRLPPLPPRQQRRPGATGLLVSPSGGGRGGQCAGINSALWSEVPYGEELS
jgi:serine/threonine protein kinase